MEETSFRQRARLAKVAAHVREHGIGTPFADAMESGTEGRMFTSDPAKLSNRRAALGLEPIGTEPVHATSVPLSVEDTGLVAEIQLSQRAHAAAASAPPHPYMQPQPGDELDPRAFPDLREHFKTEEDFARWCVESGRSPEDLAKIVQVMTEQETSRREIGKLHARIPTWREDLAQVVDFAKANGASEAEMRKWFRNPDADTYEALHERWQRSLRTDTREALRKHPRDRDAQANYFASLESDAPSAPTRARLDPAERAAMAKEVLDTGMASEKPWSEDSVNAAGRLFEKLID